MHLKILITEIILLFLNKLPKIHHIILLQIILTEINTNSHNLNQPIIFSIKRNMKEKILPYRIIVKEKNVIVFLFRLTSIK
jgi:hypothetical protein